MIDKGLTDVEDQRSKTQLQGPIYTAKYLVKMGMFFVVSASSPHSEDVLSLSQKWIFENASQSETVVTSLPRGR